MAERASNSSIIGDAILSWSDKEVT